MTAAAIRRIVFFAAALLLSLLALLPMRLGLAWAGLDRAGLAARGVQGSVWLGGLEEAELGPARIGSVAAHLRMLPLLVGRARLDVARSSPLPLAAGLVVRGGGFGIDDASGSFALDAVGGLPAARIDLSGVGARFADGACAEADGLVRATPVGGTAVGGTLRCDGADLLLPLASQSGIMRIDLRMAADGRIRLQGRSR